jgi:aquaporin Z
VNAKLVRPITAEFVATALFVLAGAGAVVMNAVSANTLGPLAVALVHGIALAILVSMTLSVSGGHLNPAVTVALLAAGKVDRRTAGLYVLAQLAGAVVGALLVKLLFPLQAGLVTSLGTPAMSVHIGDSLLKGAAIEALFTFFLVSAVFGTVVAAEAPKLGGFAIGLVVFVGAIVAGPLTGAALNPARAFGPALVAWEWHGQAAYWIGPLGGGLAAALLWTRVLLPRKT